MRWILLLLACLAPGCASLHGPTDWWSVRTIGNGDAATLRSTSHVNHGKPAREAPLEPRLLHEASRGNVSIALHHDAALAAGWSGSAWKFRRELDKALDWLQRLAGPHGARVVVTLVDDTHALDVERTHPAVQPVIDLVVAVDPRTTSQSAAVGQALATALHETAHALAAKAGRHAGNRFADEHAAALVEACYLLDTGRPGDVIALHPAAQHPGTDNYAITQSRAAAGAVVRELRMLARSGTLRADDWTALGPVFARCGIDR
ncbi:MAG TPA: hypothetical protein VFM73_01440 [Xanthomonadaceae bacterium]|nr:hypothetical protein [Xanthomonadaceae bacterium]